jgi:16S rRNA processing protein RimM
MLTKSKNIEDYQYLGTISSSKGFKGQIELKDVPEGIDKIAENSEMLVGFSIKFAKEFTLATFSKKGRKASLKLKEINSDSAVISIKEHGVFTRNENLITEEKDTLTDDLIGLKVFDVVSNANIGNIIDVWYLPGNDVWLVETEKGNLPLPVTDEVIKDVDMGNLLVTVNIIDGLWDLVETD